MNPLFSYAAPPLVGAAIGYITNCVAIRMLFKPLKPWYLFGLRIPMTPGIIPLKRHQLARNIGEMVGQHLLTSSDVGKGIAGDQFQQQLKRVIETRISNVLNKELGSVTSLIPKRFLTTFQVSIKILRLRFQEHLHDYFNSHDFAENVASMVSSHMDDFLTSELNEIISSENQEHLIGVLESAAAGFLKGPGVEEWVRAHVRNKVDDLVARDCSMKDLLPGDLTEMLLDRLEQEAPHLMHLMAGLIEEPVTQERIAKGVGSAVNNFTATLGPMAGLLGSFLNSEMVEEKVRDYLNKNGSEISKWFIDETMQQRLAAIIRKKADQIMSAPFSTLLADRGPERVEKISDMISDGILATLRDPDTLKSMVGLIREGLYSQIDRPLNDILTDLFGADEFNHGKEWAANEIVGIIRSSKVRKLIDNLMEELIENKLPAQPIGPLGSFIPKDVQHTSVDYLLGRISSLLIGEIPGLVDSLNIRDIVVRKVDSLDLLRLEGLLLSIMQEQFKYINLFGALLGFIIGLLNLIFLSAV
ncbi:MAG: DUF445 family protein [Desulfobulbaceae bacterium]|nr:DUF445 family protein [Desulfobulbaceae bacterium]